MELSWLDPGNAAITGWQYRYSRDGADWRGWEPISGSSTTSYTVQGLDNGVSYRFKVRGVNSSGNKVVLWSVAATPAASLTLPPRRAREPDAPGNLRAVSGDGQVSLSWQTPADNGSELTGYEYRQSADGGTTWSPDWKEIPGSDKTMTAYTVPDLTNGKTYIFEVRAVNGEGQGPASNRATAKPAGVPDAPGSLVAVPGGGDGQVRLSWQTPADNGSALTGYEVRRSADGGASWSPDWAAIPGSGKATISDTVSNLSSPGAYTFEVRARNAVGPGAASNRATGAWYDENGTAAVVSYPSASGWSRTGEDAAAFTVSSSGELGFVRSPDFEKPVDTGADNLYRVQVAATSPASSVPVAVRVRNIDEEGTVEVILPTTNPQVGQTLFAVLTEPDGSVTGGVWKWQKLQPLIGGQSSWEDLAPDEPEFQGGSSDGATSPPYTVKSTDLGLVLRGADRRLHRRARFRQVGLQPRDAAGDQGAVAGAGVEGGFGQRSGDPVVEGAGLRRRLGDPPLRAPSPPGHFEFLADDLDRGGHGDERHGAESDQRPGVSLPGAGGQRGRRRACGQCRGDASPDAGADGSGGGVV